MFTWSIWLGSYSHRWDENPVSLGNLGIHSDQINNKIESEWLTLAVL